MQALLLLAATLVTQNLPTLVAQNLPTPTEAPNRPTQLRTEATQNLPTPTEAPNRGRTTLSQTHQTPNANNPTTWTELSVPKPTRPRTEVAQNLPTLDQAPTKPTQPRTLVAQNLPTPTQAPTPTQTQANPAPDTTYILGPGDQLTVFIADLPEEFADKTFRIDTAGDISLPLIGHLHAAGQTTSELETEAAGRLNHILKKPQVAISLASFGSKTVSILGAVNTPGIKPIEGPKTLFEMLSTAGGLRQDAGAVVKITRSLNHGPIPVPNATTDPTGQDSVATIKLKDIINATNPTENVIILPGDTISVPKADLVYAVGSVTKPGGFMLNEHETLSALQVVSLAEGTSKTAALDKAKILRAIPNSPNRTEIPVNLKLLMAGKGTDVRLQPEDILFVPNSAAKSAGFRAIDSIVAAATGVAVYGRY